MMEVKAVVETSSSRQRAFNTSNQYRIFLHFFPFFVGHFCPRGCGSTTKINSDPDPHRWGNLIILSNEIKVFLKNPVRCSVILIPVGLASALGTLANLPLHGELAVLYTLTGQFVVSTIKN
jgi:hypothetical protein